jgi:hypothetical protein
VNLRFRVGPLTFGRTGARLNLWRRGSGVSIPLSGQGHSFGKVGVGPISWYFGGKVIGVLLITAVIGFVLLLALG